MGFFSGITVIFIMTVLAVLVLVLGAAVVFLVYGHRRKSNKKSKQNSNIQINKHFKSF